MKYDGNSRRIYPSVFFLGLSTIKIAKYFRALGQCNGYTRMLGIFDIYKIQEIHVHYPHKFISSFLHA